MKAGDRVMTHYKEVGILDHEHQFEGYDWWVKIPHKKGTALEPYRESELTPVQEKEYVTTGGDS